MEVTTTLEERAPQPDAVFDPVVVLDGLVSTLQSVESAIAGLQALREHTLALASRVEDAMAADDGARPGSEGSLRWDSVELAQRAVAAEIVTATRLSDRMVQRQMGQTVEILDRFPATFEALAGGRISLTHARIIQDASTSLDGPETLARFEAAVLPCAEVQAPCRLRRVAAREAEKARPEALGARHERAVAERCVRVTPLPDGMAELAATLPAAVAYGIHDRLTRMAKVHAESHGAGRANCGRSRDQLRADLLSDLLLRGTPAGHDTPDGLLASITGRVDVTVPVLSLMGETHSPDQQAIAAESLIAQDSGRVPAELDGRHPIDPETARILAGQAAAWNRVLTDPITAAVLTVDRYRPGEDLRRLLTARDSRCRFPGCGIPARELDLDHTQDAVLGGATAAANLAGLCRRHHTLKHQTRWTVRQSGGGNLDWTSPTGRIYTDSPPTPAATTVGTANKPPPAF
jgi:Domain of unknown function (DUF222)